MNKTPQSSADGEAIKLIVDKYEYMESGCQVWDFNESFINDIKALLDTARHEGALAELEAILKQVPMPVLSYEQVEDRIKQLKGQATQEGNKSL